MVGVLDPPESVPDLPGFGSFCVPDEFDEPSSFTSVTLPSRFSVGVPPAAGFADLRPERGGKSGVSLHACYNEAALSPLTFSIPSSGYQVMQSTMIASDLTCFTTFRGCDQFPNEILDLLVSLIAIEAVQQLRNK